MSETPPEGDLDILDALTAFTTAVGTALDDMCSYSLTVGEAYVPFGPDEDDEDVPEECEPGEDGSVCSQAWVRVMGAQIINVAEQSFESGSCGGEVQLTLEVGALRCFGIPEDGEAPSATDVMAAAFQAIVDMQTIYCTAMSTEVWTKITAGTWVPNGPLGGQYGGVWTFDVVVS